MRVAPEPTHGRPRIAEHGPLAIRLDPDEWAELRELLGAWIAEVMS